MILFQVPAVALGSAAGAEAWRGRRQRWICCAAPGVEREQEQSQEQERGWEGAGTLGHWNLPARGKAVFQQHFLLHCPAVLS